MAYRPTTSRLVDPNRRTNYFRREFPKMELGSAEPKRPSYFYIAWGSRPEYRWAHGKHTDVREACCEAFGMSKDDMRAWNLGTYKTEALRLMRRIMIQERATNDRRRTQHQV